MTIVPTAGSVSGNDTTGMIMQMQQDIMSLQRYLQFNNSQVVGGVVTLTWSGGDTSAAETIIHSLGSAPTAIVLTPLQTISGGPISPFVVTGSVTDSVFEVAAIYYTTLTASVVFSWVAIL